MDSNTTATTLARSGVTAELERYANRLSELANGDSTLEECREVIDAVAQLLPDERAADLLDEVARADVIAPLRAAAAHQLVRNRLLDLDDPLVRRLLSDVGPLARLSMAEGLHGRDDPERARGLVRPLLRAVHSDIRQRAQLLYRGDPSEYADMRSEDIVRDAEEPGWLHRSWAARELISRGELEHAWPILDEVIGHWTFFGDAKSKDEPLLVIDALARHRDNPRARRLLERAQDDALPPIRAAAAEALGAPASLTLTDEPDIDLTDDVDAATPSETGSGI